MLQCNTYRATVESRHSDLPKTNSASLSNPKEETMGEDRLYYYS